MEEVVGNSEATESVLVVDDGMHVDGEDDGPAPWNVSESIEGQRPICGSHIGGRDVGLRVRCPHCGTVRFRSLRLEVGTFGPNACANNLGCWLAGALEKRDRHSKLYPNKGEMRAYMARNGPAGFA